MGEWTFNRDKCIKALKKLGFYQKNGRKGARHDKFYPPSDLRKIENSQQPPFIMIPRHRYLHCQNAIVSEIEKLGGIELVIEFREKMK